MKRFVSGLLLALLSTAALAQNPTCPTRPSGDNTNACASTAFVQNIFTGGGGVAQIANTFFAGPTTGGNAPPTFRTIAPADIPTSPVLDTVGSTRGSVLERGASGWQAVTPGNSGLPWVSNGAGADPAYQALTGAGISSTAALTIAGATINPTAATINPGFAITQTGPTTGTQSLFSFNTINVQADQSSVVGTVYGLDVRYGFGGGSGNLQGQHVALHGFGFLNGASNAANPTKVYIGVSGESGGASNDGGTNTGAGAAGTFDGIYASALVGNGATNLQRVAGIEVNTGYQTGSSGRYHFGVQITQWSTHAVSASEIDAGLYIANQSGAVGWANYGIAFDTSGAGIGTLFKSTATIIGTKGAMTVTNGVDLSSATITGSAFKSAGFNVGTTGLITTGTTGGAGGSLSLTAATSGTAVVGVSATGAHVTFAGGAAPSLTAGCNGAGSSVTGSDNGGLVTGQTAAATTCTMTFAHAWGAQPGCTATGISAPLSSFNYSASTMTVTFASAGNYFWSFVCLGT